MRKFFGCKRVIYNQALAINEEMCRLMGRKHTRYQLDKLIREWKKETPWLSEAPSHCLQQARSDLERAQGIGEVNRQLQYKSESLAGCACLPEAGAE
jgi:transposase